MNKFLVCFLLISSFSFSLFADEPDEKLHKQCIYPTVKLEIPPEFGGGGGSGVIIRSVRRTAADSSFTNVVLTVAHNLSKGPVKVCVPKFKDWSTVTGYDKFPCVVFSASTKYDLAVVLFETPEVMPTAEIDFDPKIYIGSKVFKLGFGISDECRLDRGEITSTHTAEAFTGHLRLNAYTIFGDSGGPSFLSSNYKVIGITKAIRGHHGQALPNFSYVIPVSFFKVWNAETQDSLNFVCDLTKPIPYSVAELVKRNTLLNLKAQLESVKKELILRKAMEDSLEKEIKRIEEGRELPVPTMPDVPPPPEIQSNEPAPS